jgi:hypothetical protein
MRTARLTSNGGDLSCYPDRRWTGSQTGPYKRANGRVTLVLGAIDRRVDQSARDGGRDVGHCEWPAGVCKRDRPDPAAVVLDKDGKFFGVAASSSPESPAVCTGGPRGAVLQAVCCCCRCRCRRLFGICSLSYVSEMG